MSGHIYTQQPFCLQNIINFILALRKLSFFPPIRLCLRGPYFFCAKDLVALGRIALGARFPGPPGPRALGAGLFLVLLCVYGFYSAFRRSFIFSSEPLAGRLAEVVCDKSSNFGSGRLAEVV